MESAFAALDPTGTGEIPNELFVDVLKRSGLPVPPEDIALLVAAYVRQQDSSAGFVSRIGQQDSYIHTCTHTHIHTYIVSRASAGFLHTRRPHPSPSSPP